jgi:hypothetical protein
MEVEVSTAMSAKPSFIEVSNQVQRGEFAHGEICVGKGNLTKRGPSAQQRKA